MCAGEGGGTDEGIAGAGAIASTALDAVEVVDNNGLIFADCGDGLDGAGFGALDAGETTLRINQAAAKSDLGHEPEQYAVGADEPAERARYKNTKNQHAGKGEPNGQIAHENEARFGEGSIDQAAKLPEPGVTGKEDGLVDIDFAGEEDAASQGAPCGGGKQDEGNQPEDLIEPPGDEAVAFFSTDQMLYRTERAGGGAEDPAKEKGGDERHEEEGGHGFTDHLGGDKPHAKVGGGADRADASPAKEAEVEQSSGG